MSDFVRLEVQLVVADAKAKIDEVFCWISATSPSNMVKLP
jgi:hypothetical protein